MKNINIYIALVFLFSINIGNAQNWCSQPNPNFCPGNVFTNGDFENITGNPNPALDQDIGLASGWLPVGNGLADLACGGTVHRQNGWFLTPPNPNTGVYAGMWIQNNTNRNTNALHREGMYNQLTVPIPQGSTNYTFTFDIARGMDAVPANNARIGIYGVFNSGNVPSLAVTGLYTPLNVNLWPTPPVQVVYLGNIITPNSLTSTWQSQSISFNSSILPTGGITHILITSDDVVVNSNIRTYINFDNFCLQIQTPTPPVLCCPEEKTLGLELETIGGPHNKNPGEGWTNNEPASFVESKIDISLPPGYANIPITEMRLSVVDMSFEDNIEACGDCIDNPANWAALSYENVPDTDDALPIGSAANGFLNGVTKINDGSNLPPATWYTFNKRYNTKELVWENPNGVLLAGGEELKFETFLPPFSEIPCCSKTVRISYKVTYKFADCTQCEVILPTEIYNLMVVDND